MSSRGARWAGAVVAVLAAVGLAVYFWVVGLDEADKLASALSAFLGLAGLTVSLYATRTSPTTTPPAIVEGPADPPTPTAEAAPAAAEPLALPSSPPSPPVPSPGPGGVINEIRGGVFHDTVIQAGYIGGSVNLTTPPSTSPPAEPPPAAEGPQDPWPTTDHRSGR